MPWGAPAAVVPEIETVATLAGRVQYIGDKTEQWDKARVFVLADRTAVLVIPGAERKTVERVSLGEVSSSEYSTGSKILTVQFTDGAVVQVNGGGCGCNLGAVGGAGPVEGPYSLVKVREPEWHSET